MKNTLWTFGCSFTADWHPVGGPVRNAYDEYKEWRGGSLPPVWPTILAKNLGMNLQNKGQGATGNDNIFSKFCNNSHLIKQDDVVIIGWSHILRYLLSSPDGSHLMDILPSEKYPEHPENITEYLTINRSLSAWQEQIISYIRLIENYCNSIGIKLFFWTSDRDMYTYFQENYKDIDTSKFIDWRYNNMLQMVREVFHGAPYFTIIEETNQEVVDYHFCETGHKYQADIILKHLLKNGVSI
jgi:hypothetical protein